MENHGSTACQPRSGNPGESAENEKWNAIGSDRIRVGSRIKGDTQTKLMTAADQALETTKADLKIAEATGIVGIQLLSLAVIGQKSALGDCIESGDSHDQTEPIDLGGLGQRTCLELTRSGEHLRIWVGGAHHGKRPENVPARVPTASGKTISSRAVGRIACQVPRHLGWLGPWLALSPPRVLALCTVHQSDFLLRSNVLSRS